MSGPGYAERKKSGVAWLGEIPRHWEVMQLGRIGRFFKGGGGNKGDEVNDGLPCVRYGDLYTQHEFSIVNTRSRISEEDAAKYAPLQFGDVLFAGSGETIEEIGKSAVNLMQEPAYCGGDVIVLRPSIDVDAGFLGYATSCTQANYQKSCMGKGVTVMHIYGRQLKHLVIALPPLAEQTAIARYIDRKTAQIGALIEKKQQQIALLKERRIALISHAVTKGLDSNAAMKNSGVSWLGKVPASWKMTRLKHLCSASGLYGANIAAEHYAQTGVRFLRTTDITDDGELKKGGVFLPENLADGYLLNDGDLLISRSGTVGRSFLYDSTLHGDCAYAGYLVRFVPAADVLPKYLFFFTKTKSFSGFLRNLAVSSTIDNVNADKYANLSLPLPPLSEQKSIVNFLNRETARVDGLIKKIEKSINLLHEHRTALISAAVTGKIDVR